MRRPLMSSTKRERMPRGSGMSGRLLDTVMCTILVMAGFIPAIHALLAATMRDVDARHKAGHDDDENWRVGVRRLRRQRPYNRSTIVTLAMPPPSHIVCRP